MIKRNVEKEIITTEVKEMKRAQRFWNSFSFQGRGAFLPVSISKDKRLKWVRGGDPSLEISSENQHSQTKANFSVVFYLSGKER